MEEVLRVTKRFKNSLYYADTKRVRIRAEKIKSFVERQIKGFSEFDEVRFRNELKSLLRRTTMVGEDRPPVVRDIVEKNSPARLLLAFMKLISLEITDDDIEKLRRLVGVDWFVATELVSLFDDRYICYHESLIRALNHRMIRPVVERLRLEIPERIESIEEYIKLRDVCSMLKELLGFDSFGSSTNSYGTAWIRTGVQVMSHARSHP